MDDPIHNVVRDQVLHDVKLIAIAGTTKDQIRWSEAARVAYDRLYRHFWPRLYAFCTREVFDKRRLPKGECQTDFFIRSFNRLMTSIGRLKLDDAMSLGEIEKRVWLFFQKPVEWTLKDIWRAENLDDLPELFKAVMGNRGKWQGQRPDADFAAKQIRIETALARFPEMDRDILRTAFMHLDVQTGKVNWPDEERERLCREYRFVSTNALNQYRRRKFLELKEAVGC